MGLADLKSQLEQQAEAAQILEACGSSNMCLPEHRSDRLLRQFSQADCRSILHNAEFLEACGTDAQSTIAAYIWQCVQWVALTLFRQHISYRLAGTVLPVTLRLHYQQQCQ